MDLRKQLAGIAQEQRALAARIDALLSTTEGGRLDKASWPIFDPYSDKPAVTPSAAGTREQRDWTSMVLWGTLAALNARENRGASRDEVVAIAKAAGYSDGRGWNAWTGWVDLHDGRWIDRPGEAHLRTYYERQERRLPIWVEDWLSEGGFTAGR
jgi:hypothetical protein